MVRTSDNDCTSHPGGIGVFTVGLVDEHPMAREGIGNVINAIPGASLRLSASSGAEALEYLAKSRLDVLLLDISQGREDGLQVIKDVLALQPDLRVVILTVSDSESHLVQAFTHGACGFLLKDCDRRQITNAILAGNSGVAVISPLSLVSSVFQGWLRPESTLPALGPVLSERELDVLRLVAQGNSNKDIAEKLFLAESTIKKYSHNAMGKLGASSRGTAAIRALRLGLISIDPPADGVG